MCHKMCHSVVSEGQHSRDDVYALEHLSLQHLVGCFSCLKFEMISVFISYHKMPESLDFPVFISGSESLLIKPIFFHA